MNVTVFLSSDLYLYVLVLYVLHICGYSLIQLQFAPGYSCSLLTNTSINRTFRLTTIQNGICRIADSCVR